MINVRVWCIILKNCVIRVNSVPTPVGKYVILEINVTWNEILDLGNIYIQ